MVNTLRFSFVESSRGGASTGATLRSSSRGTWLRCSRSQDESQLVSVSVLAQSSSKVLKMAKEAEESTIATACSKTHYFYFLWVCTLLLPQQCTPPKRFCICIGSEESSEDDGHFLKSHWPNTHMYCVFSYCQYVNSSAILVRKNLSPQAPPTTKIVFFFGEILSPKPTFLIGQKVEEKVSSNSNILIWFSICVSSLIELITFEDLLLLQYSKNFLDLISFT